MSAVSRGGIAARLGAPTPHSITQSIFERKSEQDSAAARFAPEAETTARQIEQSRRTGDSGTVGAVIGDPPLSVGGGCPFAVRLIGEHRVGTKGRSATDIGTT